MREENSRKPALRNAIELRRRLESTRTQERRARISDAASEAEQALYDVLRISPPESSAKSAIPILAPRKPRRGAGRTVMAWLDRKALDNVRSQLALLVSTPSHHNRAQTRAAKQAASIWASRYATHLVILILLLGIAALGGFKGLTVQAANTTPQAAASIDESNFGPNDIAASFNNYSALDGNAAAKADVASRVELVTRFPERVKGYSVQQGDTLASIATKFGLDKPTLMWANHIVDPDANLIPGTTLLVLPIKGMYHTVVAGDTVESIAAEYQVEPAAITGYKPNQLQPPYTLNVGDALIVPGGIIPPRDHIITYYPHPGETINAVAQKFGLSVSTVLLANPDLGDGSNLSSNDELSIPPIDGIVRTVVAGDTIDSIAAYYGVSPQVLADFAPNHLQAGQQLVPDTVLIVPGGVIPPPPPPIAPPSDNAPIGGSIVAQATDTSQASTSAKTSNSPSSRSSRPATSTSKSSSSTSKSSSTKKPSSSKSSGSSGTIPSGGNGIAHGSFIWPAGGVITQGFWAWEWGHRHGGLDIANAAGTPIVAADGGTVVEAGWNIYGFGYCVMIDHGNGFKTLYGHMLHQPAVWVGEKVSRGQYIGPMGSTGNSTGPHVHFAIYYNGILRDPLNYLG